MSFFVNKFVVPVKTGMSLRGSALSLSITKYPVGKDVEGFSEIGLLFIDRNNRVYNHYR
jgi:hypothetical protein